MSTKRIVPDITTEQMEESRGFYQGVLGLELAMDMGWVMTFVSPTNASAQITVLQTSASEGPRPQMTIEVDDVDAVHEKAVALGCEIVYPITDESWGVRRFFLRDPNGVVLNVMSHESTD